MRNITLDCNASIEAVLPMVEEAMETGEICRINNINYLGKLGVAALTMLAMADGLLDSATGKVFHQHPGFCLIGVDDAGKAKILS